MRRIVLIFSVSLVIVCLLGSVSAFARDKSCWGQATAVFAQMRLMGEHASQQPTPRFGLANLARALFDAGVLDEPTLDALGEFVANELGLDIDRCMNNSDAVIEAEEAVAAQMACWGQATRVFAQMGLLGKHASQQPNPRLGLRNLARALADAGVIPDDSMASLGAFVADELGLSIDACD